MGQNSVPVIRHGPLAAIHLLVQDKELPEVGFCLPLNFFMEDSACLIGFIAP